MSAAARSILTLVIAFTALPFAARSAPAVLQHGYDASVTNSNLAETSLNTSNVNVDSFGKLFTLPVDDKIQAQPLYVPNVTLPGLGQHNVLIVATMSDTVYAFDADAPGAALWSVNLAGLFSTTAVSWLQFEIASTANTGNLGILSTPVVDPATNILYVVACTLEAGTMAYRLHAIDITTGTEPYGPGVLIQASYGGITFNARYQTQRASLALAGNPANQVVFAFGAMEDESVSTGNYTGWVMAYHKLTLQQTGAFAVVTAGNGGGGTWQSGRPPAVDADGNFYVFTGNAWGKGYDGVNNFSQSVLKFNVSNGLSLVDWFTPSNFLQLDKTDLDLASSGPMLVPGTSPQLLAGGGKSGDLYVLNTANLGKFVPNDTQVVQKENITRGTQGAYEIRAGLAYWARSAQSGGPLMYDWAGNDVLKAFSFDGSRFSTAPVASAGYTSPLAGSPVAVSANGSQQGSGIVWATTLDATLGAGAGVLHAFDAANIASELWNSAMFTSRDVLGGYLKHLAPVVANGKVYVVSGANKVNVYGLGVAPAAFSLSPTSLSFGRVQVNSPSKDKAVTLTNVSTRTLNVQGITLTGPLAAQYSQTNNCGTSISAGGTCTISVVFTPAATGAQGAWLNVNLAGVGIRTSALSGVGVAASLGMYPAALVFGNMTTGAQSAPQQVTVTNAGTAAVSLTGIAIAGIDPTQFSQTSNCSAPIAAGSSCTISVVFAPTAAGGKMATLTVSGGGATSTVSLSGTGIVPFSISPATLAFGNVNTGTASTPLQVTVTNNGNAALPISGISVSGTGAAQFSQTNTCGTPVAPGATCKVNVVFAPVATGSQSASLSITADAGTQSSTLTGTGTSSATATFSLSPASLAFGVVTANTPSAPLPVTVTNTGTVPVTISGIAFTTGTPASFSQTSTCGPALAPGTSCIISVVFSPTIAGYQVSQLGVTSNAGAVTNSIGVNGTGSVPFTVSPASLAFGGVAVGTASAPMILTVTNAGSVTMPFPTLFFANPGAASYSQTNTCGSTLAAGASCPITVTFTPAAAGIQSAVLKLREFNITTTVTLGGSGI